MKSAISALGRCAASLPATALQAHQVTSWFTCSKHHAGCLLLLGPSGSLPMLPIRADTLTGRLLTDTCSRPVCQVLCYSM